MYTYVAGWSIPRAQWAEMEKTNASTQSIMEKVRASGTLVGFGNDTALVHEPDGATHDGWWSATSMAGILNVLDPIYQAGSANATVFNSATEALGQHLCEPVLQLASRFVEGLIHARVFVQVQGGAPDNALDTLSKNLFMPLFEKLLADGTIYECDIHTQAIHTEAPGRFFFSTSRPMPRVWIK